MCEMCDAAFKTMAEHGGQAHVLTANDAPGARRAANEIWKYAAAEVAPVHREMMRHVSMKTIEATKAGDKLAAAIYSLASAALIELLARKLEREAAAGN